MCSSESNLKLRETTLSSLSRSELWIWKKDIWCNMVKACHLIDVMPSRAWHGDKKQCDSLMVYPTSQSFLFHKMIVPLVYGFATSKSMWPLVSVKRTEKKQTLSAGSYRYQAHASPGVCCETPTCCPARSKTQSMLFPSTVYIRLSPCGKI